MEVAWVAPHCKCSEVSGNHQNRISQVDGDSDTAPVPAEGELSIGTRASATTSVC